MKIRVELSKPIQAFFLISLGILIIVIWYLLSRPETKRRTQSKAAANTSLSFVVPTINLAVDQVFPVISEINPNSINQITAAEIHIVFDPRMLELLSIVPSNQFSQPLASPVIDNVAGTGSMVVAVPLQDANSSAIIFPIYGYPQDTVPPFNLAQIPFNTVQAPAAVAVLNFRVVAPGTSSISYSQETKAAAFGETNNVVTVMSPATISVSGPTSPSPTAASSCHCQTDRCLGCSFNLYPDVSYSNPIGCGLTSSVFLSGSQPNQQNKDLWCRAAQRTQGDANQDNAVNTADYLYYVQAVNGGHIPSSVNPDFSGDDEIGSTDRGIVIQSLSK